MLKIELEIDSLEKLDKYISFVDKFANLGKNIEFQKEMQKKCLEEVKKYARKRLMGTTNEEYYQQYIDTIFIRENEDPTTGFQIVSNLVIEKPTTHHSEGYPFSISMAFEYGTGIIGIGSADAPSNYRYNVNENYVNYNDEKVLGWWIPIEKSGDSVIYGTSRSGKAVITRGYEGMEIFRFASAEIMSQLPKWIKDFQRKMK
jgi:hypothetical protein